MGWPIRLARARQCTRAATGRAPQLTTHVPYGSEHAVGPQEFPQFTTGNAQYPPAPDHYVPPRQHPPGAYPEQVSYPQPGGYPQASGAYQADAYPQNAPYPPADAYVQAGGYPQNSAYPMASAYAQNGANSPQVVPAQPGAGYPPPAAYPMAPPWAAAPQPAPTADAPPAAFGPAAPYGRPMPEHGGLLVPYPDEMRHASQAQPPAVWPVAAFTFFFLIFGAISASRRGRRAHSGRNSAAPYWITFLITWVAASFIWLVIGAVVIGPFIDSVREGNRLAAVERNVIQDGQLKEARITATAAQCHAVGDRDIDGTRDYLCQLTLADGRTASLSLTADQDGNWKSQSTN